MRLSLLLVVVTWCVTSPDVSSKPISVDDTLLDIVSKALDGGSDKDKAESISLVLELLAQIDLPTLCKSIAADASEYTRVDDIIARAASTYDVTPAATEQLGDEDLSESEQDAVNVTQGTEPLTQTEATAAEKHKAPQLLADPDDNQVFQDNIFPEELQNIVDSYNYVNDLDPNGPEYSADSLYNDMLYPRDQIYDYYDLSDNLIYDVVAAAAAAGPKGNNKNIWPDPEGNDNKVFPWLEPKDMKDENLWLDPEDKDAAALFFPEGLLAFSAFAAQEQPGKDEEVFIQGSESVKPEQALSAENLRLEMTEEDDNDDNDTSSGSQTDSVDAVTTAPSLTVSTTSEDVTTGAANTTDELDADNDASDFLTTLASLLFSTTDAPTAVSEEETKNEENMDENDSEEMEDSDESSEEISTYAPESETTETTNTPSSTTTTSKPTTTESPSTSSSISPSTEAATTTTSDVDTTQKEQKAKEAKKIVHPYKTRSEDGEMRVMADPSEKKARAELYHSLKIGAVPQTPENKPVEPVTMGTKDTTVKSSTTTTAATSSTTEAPSTTTTTATTAATNTTTTSATTTSTSETTTTTTASSEIATSTTAASSETAATSTGTSSKIPTETTDAYRNDSATNEGVTSTQAQTEASSSINTTNSDVLTEAPVSAEASVSESTTTAQETNATARANETNVTTSKPTATSSTDDSSDVTADDLSLSSSTATSAQSTTTQTSPSQTTTTTTTSTTTTTTTTAPSTEKTTVASSLTPSPTQKIVRSTNNANKDKQIFGDKEKQSDPNEVTEPKTTPSISRTAADSRRTQEDHITSSLFRQWAGREIKDKWTVVGKKRGGSSQASAVTPKSPVAHGTYRERYPSYKVHGHKLDLQEAHTPEVRWVNAKYSKASVDTKKQELTTPSSEPVTKYNKNNKNLPKQHAASISMKKNFPSMKYNSVPRKWSPFGPRFAVPNLGTLWGINPNPSFAQNTRSYYPNAPKFNDKPIPAHLRYSIPSSRKMDVKADKMRTNEVSYKVKDDTRPKVTDSDLSKLGVHQKTIMSEAASSSNHVRYNGYACPGMFGYFGDVMDCRSFFICSWGVPYRFYCPSGTLWNPSESVCDWSRNVRCSSK